MVMRFRSSEITAVLLRMGRRMGRRVSADAPSLVRRSPAMRRPLLAEAVVPRPAPADARPSGPGIWSRAVEALAFTRGCRIKGLRGDHPLPCSDGDRRGYAA